MNDNELRKKVKMLKATDCIKSYYEIEINAVFLGYNGESEQRKHPVPIF